MIKKKGQATIEYSMLITFSMFTFIIIASIVTAKMYEIANEKQKQFIYDYSEVIINEIIIAASVTDGYERKFEVPNEIDGKNYSIKIKGTDSGTSELIFEYMPPSNTHTTVRSLPNQTVANITKGKNIVKKINGIVYVNIDNLNFANNKAYTCINGLCQEN